MNHYSPNGTASLPTRIEMGRGEGYNGEQMVPTPKAFVYLLKNPGVK